MREEQEEGLLYPLKLVHGLLCAAQQSGASIAKARVVLLSSAKKSWWQQMHGEAMLNETAPADLAIFRLDRPELSSE